MATSNDPLSAWVQHIRFVGRDDGLVKTLRGFRKNLHTVPDSVNATTSAFLARLCSEELSEEAEAFFQRVRTEFGYKRKELALDVTSPRALLTGKDFVFELDFILKEDDPARYGLLRSLHSIRTGETVRTPEFEAVFASVFSEMIFALTKGAPVEAVVDAVEALDEGGELRVTYPSDCSACTLTVGGVDAEVVFDGSELSMIFPRRGSPRELIEAFESVRHAFALTKNKALGGLLG